MFSNPDVIRRVNAGFVPVALKAALVNNPPDDEEGRLYREIGRSKIVPQGICVANSAGKALEWALMFDDDRSVLAFLDHALKRFRDYPDAQRPVATERYPRFASARLEDTQDTGQVLPIAGRHAAAKGCIAQQRHPRGTIAARVVGRALRPDGKPVADTVSQQNYVEDRFHVSVETQEALTRALAEAGTRRVRIPDEFARLCVTHAYLGELDVRPLSNPGGGSSDLRECAFWAQRVEGVGPSAIWRVEGKSEVFTDQMANAGPGDSHEVKLTWKGFIEMDHGRVTRLLLLARGTEKLKFGSARGKDDNAVASLPGGRRIDISCGVIHGIVGEPVAADEAFDAGAPPPGASAQAPGVGQDLMAALGPPFAIFLPAAQDDLKLSHEQKQKLQQTMIAVAQGLQKVAREAEGLPPPEREKKLHTFRQSAHERLRTLLAETLLPDQQERLRQIVLQQEGLFALGNPDVAAELGLSDPQKMEFMAIIQETQKRFEALSQKAQSSGKPNEVQKEAVRTRREQEARIEALLTDAQKQQWKATLGKRLAFGSEGEHPR